jgi:hypothetical protein
MWRSSNEHDARTLSKTLEINQEKGENGTPRLRRKGDVESDAKNMGVIVENRI